MSENGADAGDPFNRVAKVAVSPGLPAGRQQRPSVRHQEVLERNRWVVTDADPAAVLNIAASGSDSADAIQQRDRVRTGETAEPKTLPAEPVEAAITVLPKTFTVPLEPAVAPEGGGKKHKRKHREEGEGKDKKKRREKEKEVEQDPLLGKAQEGVPVEANGRWESEPAEQSDREPGAKQGAVATSKEGQRQKHKHTRQERDRPEPDAVRGEVVSAQPQPAAMLPAAVEQNLPAGGPAKSAKAKKDKKDKKEKGHKEKKHKSKHKHVSKEKTEAAM